MDLKELMRDGPARGAGEPVFDQCLHVLGRIEDMGKPSP